MWQCAPLPYAICRCRATTCAPFSVNRRRPELLLAFLFSRRKVLHYAVPQHGSSPRAQRKHAFLLTKGLYYVKHSILQNTQYRHSQGNLCVLLLLNNKKRLQRRLRQRQVYFNLRARLVRMTAGKNVRFAAFCSANLVPVLPPCYCGAPPLPQRKYRL